LEKLFCIIYLCRIFKKYSFRQNLLETDNEDFKIEELYEKVSEIKEISLENSMNKF
jgi:hypothetical protein